MQADVRTVQRHLSLDLMSIPEIKLEVVKLDRPHEVCKNASCLDVNADGNVIAHRCSEVAKDFFGVFRARFYKVDVLNVFNCSNCGCALRSHEIITTRYQKTLKVTSPRVRPEAILPPLAFGKKDKIQEINDHLQKLKDRGIELDDEQRQITEASAQFAMFLKSNAITPYNDSMVEYLELNINVEKKRPEGGDRNIVDGLEKLRDDYENIFQTLDATETGGSATGLTPADIRRLIDGLYGMKHIGQMLKDIMITVDEADGQAFDMRTVRVNTSRRKHKNGVLNALQNFLSS